MNPLAGTDDRDLPSAILERFRSARESNDRTLLSEFVLPVGHPMHLPVLVALIRFDRTWHSNRGNEKSLDDYRRDYPTLFEDPEVIRSLSTPEPAGPLSNNPNLDTRIYGIDGQPDQVLWHPSAGKMAEVGGAPASPFRLDGPLTGSDSIAGENFSADSSLQEAAEIYQRFREPEKGADPKGPGTVFASERARAGTVDIFCDIHRSSPEFAARLARAALSMPAAGREFFGFELVDEIGRGAFGRVFLARQKELANRLVVLKITAEKAGESQTLAQLQHTNIVPIYSVHNHDPLVALCMPFFGTTTLSDVVGNLESDGPIPLSGSYFVTTVNSRKRVTEARSTAPVSTQKVAELAASMSGTAVEPAAAGTAAVGAPAPRGRSGLALEALEGFSYVNAVLWIGSRLAEGLDHAHKRGILHRDLKPANVLLTDDGQPMLLDFNLSEDTKLRTSAAAARAGGTLPYMSPEQLEAFRSGKLLDERSDLFSLGLILFELLTGKHAFPLREGSVHEVVAKMLEDRKTIQPRLRCHNKQVSPAVGSIVLHCLETDPARRYQSARELQEDIDRHVADLPLKHAAEPSLRERTAKWRRRHPRVTSSTSVALFCGAILATLAVLFAARLQHMRRLEALDTLAGFREQVRSAKFLLNKSGPERGQLEEGVQLCTDALNRYGALEGAPFEELAVVRSLPPEEDRDALRGEVREALQTLARATNLQAEREQVPERRREKAEYGLRLLALAGGGEASPADLLQSADLNRQLGRDEEVRRLEKEAETIPPRTAAELYALALRLGDRQEFDRALKMLRESTRRNPRDVWAWFYQGYCLQQMDVDLEEAVRCYTACLALAPRHENVYLPVFNRGLAYARVLLYPEAIADFEEASRLRPNSIDPHANRGRVLMEIAVAKYPEAIAAFDAALQLDPANSRVHLLRARARELAGDAEGARRDREIGMRTDPSDEAGWIDRALARMETDPAGALADLDRALELNPTSLLGLQNKAHVLGEYPDRQEEAVAVLNKAVALYPGFVRARVGRGVHLARLGRRAEALADARESLKRSAHGETYYQAANIYSLTSRQNPEDALDCFPLLSTALQRGFGLEYVEKDSDFDPVRSHPEFQRVVKAARELHAVAQKSGQ